MREKAEGGGKWGVLGTNDGIMRRSGTFSVPGVKNLDVPLQR